MKYLSILFFLGVAVFSTLSTSITPNSFAQTRENDLGVTATIPGQSDDYNITLSSENAGEPYPQDMTLTYTITYGTLVVSNIPFTIEAAWHEGVVQDNNTIHADIVDYVTGSATTGYNNTPAVIDTIHKKITWTFTNFTAESTQQTLTFQLRTNGNYYGSSRVSLPITARLITPSFTISANTINQTYQYYRGPTPTTIPITPTPLVTPPIIPNSITSVAIQTISNTEAAIVFSTTQPSTASITYGTSASSLSQTINALSATKVQTITFPNLLPDTQYYFRISVKDSTGKRILSDIYTFKTSVSQQTAHIQLPSIFITADNKLLTLTKTEMQPTSFLTALVPLSTPYEIQFSFDDKTTIKTVQLITKNKFVLGDAIFKNTTIPEKLTSTMIEIRPGVFLSKQTSPTISGVYELIARSSDYSGNITEQKISDMIVSPPFRVMEASGNPIENARVYLSVYRKQTNTYEVENNHLIDNPTFTNISGEAFLILPPGTYKAHITALGYKGNDVVFTIGDNMTNTYPKVVLQNAPFTAINYLYYLKDAFTDSWQAYTTFMQNFAVSSRIFNLTALTLLWIFIITSFLTFSIKTHTHPRVSISHLAYVLSHLFLKNPQAIYLRGNIVDKRTNSPLSFVNIFVLDNSTKNVLYESVTNKKGAFLLKNPSNPFHIMAVKKGFEPFVVYPTTNDFLAITMHATGTYMTGKSNIIHIISRFVSMLFESCIVLSLVTEFFLTQVFGIEKMWPFIMLSLLNVLLWFYFLSLKHHKDI